MVELLAGAKAAERLTEQAIVALTAAATDATFYREGLSDEQLAHNRRIVAISGSTALAAAAAAHQHLVVAHVGGELAGYVISTIHAADDRELDWLMVHPRFHGTGVSPALMEAGMEWLGLERPMWLNVIRYNKRAIAFYRRFGFAIDPGPAPPRPIPNLVMRRPPGPLQPIR